MAQSVLHRDPRVDFFRGAAFIIILIAHIPSNWVAQWIPARFGFSDATEMFVFMSGFAAGIAFGGTYRTAGFWLGTARIYFRAWQVYVANLLLFFFVLVLMLAANAWLYADTDYVTQLALNYFLDDTGRALLGLFSMTYVPNFFDILPMYIVVLLMVPVFMALSRIHPLAGYAGCLVLYAANYVFIFELPAEVSPDRDFRAWFFNPFAWQLLFFTGFAMSMGYLKLPRFRWWLAALCLALIAVGVVYSRYGLWSWSDTLSDLRGQLVDLRCQNWRGDGADRCYFWTKSNLDVVRILHFLAIAYLVVWALKGRERVLTMGWAQPILQCGRQSLPVFMFSMILSRVYNVLMDQTERTTWEEIAFNVVAVANLIAIAYLLGWLKSNPWRPHKPARTPAPEAQGQAQGGARWGNAVPAPGSAE
ncbi:MAG: OpgC domain-containing protein [Rhodospirillaceae bacterium]|nr:OpgC domain-containing protein [Rhodospirillaceae bacterium]